MTDLSSFVGFISPLIELYSAICIRTQPFGRDLVAHYSLLGGVVSGGDFNASSYEEDLHHTICTDQNC